MLQWLANSEGVHDLALPFSSHTR